MKTRSLFALLTLIINAVATPMAMARFAEAQAAQGTISGFVVPNEVHGKEPFTFATQGTVEGEVVEVKTVEGEVVAERRPDPLGRVFLPAGLIAGTYLLTRKGGAHGDHPSSPSPIEVLPDLPNEEPKPLGVDPGTGLANLKDGLRLTGSGMNPNAVHMQIANGATQLPVLAATAREVKTGPLTAMPPGSYDFTVRNEATGETAKVDGITLFDVQSRLTKTRVANNEVTQLEFLLRPESVRGTLRARITSGPVNFGGGAQEKEVDVFGGVPKGIPILANASGAGKFSVGWELVGVAAIPPDQQEKKKPCPSEEHRLEAGAWQRTQEGPKFVAWRRMLCQIHFGCSKNLGHAGAHDFTKKKRCDEREKFTDANGNGVWDENDGAWTDTNGNKKPDPGEYTDRNGDGQYQPSEKFEDKNKNGGYDGDRSEKKYFDTKDERDKFVRENP